MNEIIGKWIQVEGQPYEGLWFIFTQEGTFEAKYEPMGIVSSGTYQIDSEQVTIQQNTHTFGIVGEFKGLFKIEEDTLKMALAAGPGQERPNNLEDARVYRKA